MKDLVVAVALTTAVQAMVAVAVFAPAVLAPAAQGEIGIAASSIGIFTTLVYLAAAFCALFSGGFVARHGPMRVNQHCLLWAGGGAALCASGVPSMIALGALAIGMGHGSVTPASVTILVKRTPDRLRNLIMSVRQSGVPIGGAIAGALVPPLILAYGWRVAALVVGVLCLSCAVALQPWRRQYDDEREDARHSGPASHLALIRMVFAHAKLRQVALTSFAYAGIQLCLASYLVVYLTERAGLSLVGAGAVFSLAMTGGVVGRVVWGAVADYLGSARIVLGSLGVSMGLCAFAIAQLSPQWPYAAVIALCVVFGASAIGWSGVFVAEVARVAPDGNVALATGASLTFTYLGPVVMPFVYWLVVVLTNSYPLAFMLVGAAALIAGFSYFRK